MTVRRSGTLLQVAAFAERTEVEGPGLRSALWLQGCTLGCPGCCNPEMFDPMAGTTRTPTQVADAVLAAHQRFGTEGLTVLGGEPLQQLAGVTSVLAAVSARAPGLGIIVFTGYTSAEAHALPGFEALWHQLDSLVTGRFQARNGEPAPGGRAVIGSANQIVEHRTERYAPGALWTGQPRAEVTTMADGRLAVLGAPALVRRLAASLAPAPQTPVVLPIPPWPPRSPTPETTG